ncbi:MAG: gamma-glutamylcyclotransferase, partial [Bacteroidota bacterium]
GLFMDHTILLKNGIRPSNPRKAYLNGHALKIGNRASLIPIKGERSYGIVMTVDDDAIHELYAEASVADYIPEEVNVTLNNDDVITATCYNLPANLLTGTNASYARSLHKLAEQEGFPDDYLEKIKDMAKITPGENNG